MSDRIYYNVGCACICLLQLATAKSHHLQDVRVSLRNPNIVEILSNGSGGQVDPEAQAKTGTDDFTPPWPASSFLPLLQPRPLWLDISKLDVSLGLLLKLNLVSNTFALSPLHATPKKVHLSAYHDLYALRPGTADP